MKKEDKDYIGTKTFFSSLAGNFASEQTYSAYDSWYNLRQWDIWDFFPFTLVSNRFHNRMKQRGLYMRAAAVVFRDRAESKMFNQGKMVDEDE